MFLEDGGWGGQCSWAFTTYIATLIIINKQRSQSTVEQEDNKKELKEESASQVRYSAHSSRSLGLDIS